VDRVESGSFADRRDPSVRGAPVESLSVATSQDRSFMAVTDREVDRAGRSRHQRDRRRLVALADDLQRAMLCFNRPVAISTSVSPPAALARLSSEQ
jgi:hypothetical protein